MESGVYRTTK